MEVVKDITAKLSEPETRETVGRFISLLSTFHRGEGNITLTDDGSFVFRVVDGAPQLTVSRDFMANLGPHGLILSLEQAATNDVVAKLGQVDNSVVKFTFDGEKVTLSIMDAIKYMDQTQNITYILENIRIVELLIDSLKLRHSELIYYMLKYSRICDNHVLRIISSRYYKPQKEYVDVIFFYGIVQRRLSKYIYDQLGLKTGTWRDL